MPINIRLVLALKQVVCCILERWDTLGSCWLDKGGGPSLRLSTEVKCVCVCVLVWEYLSPFQGLAKKKEGSLKFRLTWGTVICSRFSSKDQSLETRGM